ncbi:MAG: D-alanyl-D-alanine carboxypeptidase, partial [Clostridia bacterium]|nr:D-alanyl-D-alanine carboxypeptidase [Clostridia bacterium]
MNNLCFKLLFCYILIIFVFCFYFFPCLADDEDDIFECFDDFINDELSNTIETSSNVADSLNLNCHSCVVIDRQSNIIMYGKNESSKVKMASTTKIMTATIVLENADLSKTIEISKKAAGTGGSRLGLKPGDKITIRDLLYGLMLCSGNDAAVALAEALAGSIDGFSELMNNKAKELGLLNTHFESPHGLDSEGHYTTAYELALLTNYALKNSTFSDIVGTQNYTVTINGYPKNLRNTNELLGVLTGVYGVKTGFTNGANRCLVTACKRGNMDIVCVVLGCDTKKFRTSDSVKLIEYCFSNFDYVDIDEIIRNKFEVWKSENNSYFSVFKGVSSYLELKFGQLENSVIPVLKNSIPSINVVINLEKDFIAPVYPNTFVGNIVIYSNDGFISSTPVFTTNDILRKSTFDYFRILIYEWKNF